MLKAFVRPVPSSLSKAMHRTARALETYAPSDVRIVRDATKADVQVLHVISLDSLNALKASQSAIIQYCFLSAGGTTSEWQKVWSDAAIVWSYYELNAPRFYHSPLGADEAFQEYREFDLPRDVGVMTSGYVNGKCAEAIQDVATAASLAGLQTMHLGPAGVVGMTEKPAGWRSVNSIDDLSLARLYGRSRWVSGLRHVEGFELPAVEGLLCGARALIFDRPEMRKWYDGHATFIKECDGKRLVEQLVEIFRYPPRAISTIERNILAEKFSWERIIGRFWSELKGHM